jgi:hypothetical protein
MVNKRKALCVGINNLQIFGHFSLRGCLNDVNNMSLLLKENLGFTEENITILRDSEATKNNIITTLQKLVESTKKGECDHLFYSIASHGTGIPDLNGDEVDHADEAFVTYDIQSLGDRWDPNTIISDDEYRDLFSQIPSNIVFEGVFDTCHSGTGLRLMDLLVTRIPRYMPPPSMEAFRQIDGAQVHGLRESLLEEDMKNHVLYTGCRFDQTSSEGVIEGTWNGAFTFNFCKEIRSSGNRLNRFELITRIRKNLEKDGFTQVPQLECNEGFKSKIVGSGL